MRIFFKLFLPVIFSLIISSCHRQVNDQKTWKDKEWVDYNQIDIKENEEVYLICSLQRSGCMGKCPAYLVEIFSDETVKYHGMADVQMIGYFESTINIDQVNSIFESAEKIHYFDLSDQYPIGDLIVYDLPTTTSFLNLNGKKKKITNHNYGYPNELLEFEKQIDLVIYGLTWKTASK